MNEMWVLQGKGMKRSMNKPHGNRRLLFGNKNKRDDRGSAIVIVIISMALIGILASTILWASYLNYRIKINDLKVKNSFYSAETVVEQIVAGVKKDVVSDAVNKAYQEVVSNWDALGTDSNRESFFVMAYIEQVEKNLGVGEAGIPTGEYDRTKLADFVDTEFWTEGNPNGYIVGTTWNERAPIFRTYEENRAAPNGNGSMTIKNICVEFYDGNGLLSIINTDIAIDVPKLQFTQAGTIDRLYPYVLVGDDGIVTADFKTIGIDGSIYGGVDEHDKGGIQIGQDSHVTVENAAYVISGGDIVIGNMDPVAHHTDIIKQNAGLVVRDLSSNGVGYRTNVYAKGLAVNGSHLAISGKVFVENDLVLSGMGSSVSLAGQYFGYGDWTGTTLLGSEKDENGNDVLDGDGNVVQVNVNPAAKSSAIVINGKDSTVDLTELNTLQLAGRAYVSLSDDETESDLPHVLTGESISVKSNQIAYLVPPECVGTLDGKTVFGQNPVSKETWEQMIVSLSEYAEEDRNFKIVDATTKEAVKLGGEKLGTYGIGDIAMEDISGLNLENGLDLFTAELNRIGARSDKNIRFLYMAEKRQVYLYLVMDENNAEQYFKAYYNVNSNKESLDSYFNQYASGGIKLKDPVQGYTVLGNSMVSLADTDGENLVQLLSSVTLPEEGEGDGEEDEEGEGGEQPTDPDAYTEVSDNITDIERVKSIDELNELIAQCISNYENLNRNLMEEDTGLYNTVFENLVVLETPSSPEPDESPVLGLQDYLDLYGHEVDFETSDGLKAVLVDSVKKGAPYSVKDSDLRLVVAIGDVNVEKDFQGLIIASGTITVAENVTCKKDGEGVYRVLQATNDIDSNVPANVLCNGSGMVKSGYEDVETDELGNVSIDYSEIVRYENWIKK